MLFGEVVGFDACNPTVNEQLSVLLTSEHIHGVEFQFAVADRNSPLLAMLDGKHVDEEVVLHD
jgi:hypothetical protein